MCIYTFQKQKLKLPVFISVAWPNSNPLLTVLPISSGQIFAARDMQQNLFFLPIKTDFHTFNIHS